MNLEYGNAICYSGYREGQSPREQIYPSYKEISEDLHLLSPFWNYLRLYDSGPHAEIVLDVIEREKLDFKVMLGADIGAEENNPGCPWGAEYPEKQLASNILANDKQIDKMIALANRYSDIVCCVSIGNEASVEWTDHMVSVQRLVAFTRRVKAAVKQPVTFCENYVPWMDKLKPLADELDVISIHSYPIWEYQTIGAAIHYTAQNYHAVKQHYPDKPVIITEAGWTTRSDGYNIDINNASNELQSTYCKQLMEWSQNNKILTFVFEAFDEPWKGSEHKDEPEKHWGLYYVDRKPKPVVEQF